MLNKDYYLLYTQDLTYTFTSGGTYPVCLVAQNNLSHCTDTFCYDFIVEGNAMIIIPNVFTPNQDGQNDVWSLQLIDAELIDQLSVSIYNHWGRLINDYELEI